MGILKGKVIVSVVSTIALVCLILTLSLWNTVQSQKKEINDLIYTKASMNFRSELHTASGDLSLGSPNYGYDAVFVHGASNDLEILDGSLSNNGIPYVTQISLRLASVANDFMNSRSTAATKLALDKAYIEKVYNIVETQCYPHGQIKKSAFPEAFAQIYSISNTD